MAVRKGEIDIAVGNLLGSNIFNLLLILGSTLLAAWGPLRTDSNIVMDYWMITIMPLIFILLVTFSERVAKLSGAGLIAVYLFYMAYRVLLEAGFL